MTRVLPIVLPSLLLSVSPALLAFDENNQQTAQQAAQQKNSTATDPIEKIIIKSSTTANTKPVGTFGSPVSNLEYDPRVDLQSRNMAEAQADVTIRGGIFENTGFSVGSATLFDPQTGHYFADIPIAQEMLSSADVLTGVDNALMGVNSSVGTVSRNWKTIKTAGNASIGAGNNNFNLQRIYSGVSMALTDASDWALGLEGEYSRSESDGTIENGDHDFQRASGRIQLVGPSSQTDLFFGIQEKFFGWPNMYAPFNFNETEDLKTRLLIVNHQQYYGQDSHFEVSSYYRRHNDHYILSRENPAIFAAFHETEVKSIALSGRHAQTTAFAINYSSQFISDSITSTTLENNFTSRNYYKLSILPEYQLALQHEQQLTFRLGAAFDDTNRDESQVSLLGDITWQKSNADNSSQTFYLSYAQASQVPGYTAIGGSETGGLFRSNYDLGRENTENIELGFTLDSASWRLDSAIFYRKDDDLTDWTYSFDSTSARSANAVDIDTLGLELLAVKRFDKK